MKKPIISLIACIGKNRELGYKNDLIWKIPEDLAYFKKTTQGHVVIMGQRTFESIGRPLPNRVNIVLSDEKKFKSKSVLVARSMDEAIDIARQKEKAEVFFIGGAYVYSQAIKFADKLYLTQVHESSKADVFFPDYSDFKQVEKVGQGEYKGIRYEYLILTKNA
jgi:dihydrofolate reductase